MFNRKCLLRRAPFHLPKRNRPAMSRMNLLAKGCVAALGNDAFLSQKSEHASNGDLKELNQAGVILVCNLFDVYSFLFVRLQCLYEHSFGKQRLQFLIRVVDATAQP